MFGNLARDKATGEVTGFGSAFKPVGLINRLGTNPNREKLTDDFQLRRHWVDDLVGKDVVILEYVYKKTDDGYLRYLVYDVVEAVGRQPEATEDFDPEVDDFQGAAERLMARFMEDLADGYPKAYRPGLVTSGQAETAAVGRSAATDPFAGAPTSQPASFEPDDDLPF